MSRILIKVLLASALFIACTFMLSAQKVAIKTNMLYAASLTPNLQIELGLSNTNTLEIGLGGNWYDLTPYTKFKHILLQPEYRWWLCETFNGSFFGVHAHGALFNAGGFDLPIGRLKNFKEHRYEGYLYGAGISYGYQWMVSPRWNIEASIGAGYAHTNYEKYECATCGDKLGEGNYNYFGVTKAALSLIYIIK